MSVRLKNTTADFLEWNQMTCLVRNLFDDGNYSFSLLIAVGCFTGLRISDLLKLKWCDILNVDNLIVTEQKTDKKRTIKLNPQLQRHIKACYKVVAPDTLDTPCFLSRIRTVYSVQRINVVLKNLKYRYSLKISNFSSHSLRKSFGRRIYENAGNSEHALVMLSQIFNHSNTAITRRYLGLKQEEIFEMYDSLSF